MKQRFYFFFSIIIAVMISISSCKEDNEMLLPVVQTDSATSVTNNSVELNGVITDEGGSAVTTRGFCISEDPNPDLNDILVSSGSGPGEFSEEIFFLQSNKTFYYKAFATNSAGTAYGAEYNFTTEPELDPGPSLTLKGGAGYTSDDAVIQIGSLIKVGVIGVKSPVSGNKLSRFRLIFTSNNIPITLMDTTLNADSFNWETEIEFNSIGEGRLSFELTDKGSMKSEKSFTITVQGPETKKWSNVELGSYNDPIGSFFSSSEGFVYSVTQTFNTPANQAKIDFIFFKSIANGNTIASPDDVDANGINGFMLDLWTNKNQTRFNPTTITAAQFDAIGANYQFPAFDLVQVSTKMNMLEPGDVFLFKTATNKVGLVKVISTYTKGDKMKIDVVMEK